nr:MBL fold metallo-hydrolase [Clostridia bacterium]
MAKIHVFGSCSGTEPYPGRHHCSYAIEPDGTDGKLYWFDAGECCAHTAYNMGLDPLKIQKIFISHPHADHVCGLPHLIWTVFKLSTRQQGRMPDAGGISMVIPDTAILDAALLLLDRGRGHGKIPVTAEEIHEGVIFDDGIVKVEAIHNNHIKHEEGTPWRSFSFRTTIRENGTEKVVIGSGDIKHPTDVEYFLKDGCDAFMMESGHHNPPEVAKWIVENDVKIGKLCFIHHGRHLLDTYDDTVKALRAEYGDRECIVTEDGMTIVI